jgi:chaperone protein EcpD
MKVFSRALCAMTLAVGSLGSAYAGIQVNGTRVIYPADQREVSLSMVNNGHESRLIEAWIDTGDATEKPETTKAPFIITPPMSRVDPGKGQTLRITFTGADLPQDRETVFWLNVLEIPPKPKAAKDESPNFMQFAIRSRFKLFYRPKGLPGNPDSAIDQLSWHLVSKGQGYAMECTNDTAYNISFSDVALKGAKHNDAVSKGGMCPTKGKMSFPVEGDANAAGGKVEFSAINDFGGFESHEANFTR